VDASTHQAMSMRLIEILLDTDSTSNVEEAIDQVKGEFLPSVEEDDAGEETLAEGETKAEEEGGD